MNGHRGHFRLHTDQDLLKTSFVIGNIDLIGAK